MGFKPSRSRLTSWISVIDIKTRDRSESGFPVSASILTSGGVDAKGGKINVQIAKLRTG